MEGLSKFPMVAAPQQLHGLQVVSALPDSLVPVSISVCPSLHSGQHAEIATFFIRQFCVGFGLSLACFLP